MFKTPRKLGEKVRVSDETHARYQQVGHLQRSRVDDGVVQVLVFFPTNKSRGHMEQLLWSQCKRDIN